jgi:hypothetical protein
MCMIIAHGKRLSSSPSLPQQYFLRELMRKPELLVISLFTLVAYPRDFPLESILIH